MPAASETVIIAVGDEVLSGHTQDTNSRFIAERVFAAGYPARRIEVVADRLEDIVDAIHRALAEPSASRVIVCGGIGPTPDDRTFEAVAVALNRPLEENPEALAHIRGIVSRMHAAGWIESPEVSEGNLRSARVPSGGTVLHNRRGMAPPMAYEVGPDRWVFVLPGVPRELTTIVAEELLPVYFGGGAPSVVAELRYPGVPEAELFAPLRTLASEFSDVSAGSYPQTEAREVIIRLRGADGERVARAAARMRALDPRAATASPADDGDP